MLWRKEDWGPWLGEESDRAYGEPQHRHVMHEILRRIPGRARKTVATLDGGEPLLQGYLAEQFQAVVRPDAGRFHVGVVGRSVLRTTDALDRLLADANRRLFEGGFLIAVFPACREQGPFPMQLAGDSPVRRGLHEVELQYRLHRAGFQGGRICRYEDGLDDADVLLCMAVRRTAN